MGDLVHADDNNELSPHNDEEHQHAVTVGVNSNTINSMEEELLLANKTPEPCIVPTPHLPSQEEDEDCKYVGGNVTGIELDDTTLLPMDDTVSMSLAPTTHVVPTNNAIPTIPECKVHIEPLTPKRFNTTLPTSFKRNTPMNRRTRSGAASQKLIQKAAQGQQESSNIQEIVILRAENAVLKNAIHNLEQTVASQKNELLDFRAELKFLSLEMKKVTEAREVSEKKMDILLDEQEKKCLKRVLDVSSDSQKKRDKISSKIQQLSLHNCSEKADNVNTLISKSMELETFVKNKLHEHTTEHNEGMCNLQADIDRVDHVAAGIQQQINAMKREPDSSSSVTDSGPQFLQTPLRPTSRTEAPLPTAPHNHTPPWNTVSHDHRSHNNKHIHPTVPAMNNSKDKRKELKDHKSEKSLTNEQAQDGRNENVSRQRLAKTLIVMDSNKKHLSSELWKNSTMLFCPTVNELSSKLPALLQEHKPDLVLIHTGVNDLDKRDAATVARKLAHTVKQLSDSDPKLKIIVSEITPRKETKDDEVIICNEHLHNYLDHLSNVTMALHSNLRTPTWEFYEDDKHLLQSSIRKFASNLKIALRTAIGMGDRDARRKTTVRKQKTNSVGEFKKRLMEVLQEM